MLQDTGDALLLSVKVFHEFGPVRYGKLRGVGRRGGAQVRDVVGDGNVRLMPHGGDNGNFGLENRPGDGFVAIAGFVGVTMTVVFLALKHTMGLRVSETEEVEGLDVHEHGYPGYGESIGIGAPAPSVQGVAAATAAVAGSPSPAVGK